MQLNKATFTTTFTSEVIVKVGLDKEVVTINVVQVESSLDHFLKLAEINHQLLHNMAHNNG